MMKRIAGVIALGLLAACAGTDSQVDDETGRTALELDDVTTPPTGVSLLVLAPTTDRGRFADTVAKLDGIVMHSEGSRFAVAKLPVGADAILTKAGLIAHYERAVDPQEIANTTDADRRFIRVFDNRYYAPTTPPRLVSTMTKRVRPAGEPFEGTALVPELVRFDGGIVPPPLDAGSGTTPIPVIDRNTTPFATGTIVVSIILPESNGVADPSTEDWTEDSIVEAYEKVQTALESFSRTEPNANLNFILHYESSPIKGGLVGTVDSDYEFGKHAEYTDYAGEMMATAPMLARLVGHPVTVDQVWDASYEYLNNLRTQYKADGAYYIKIAANQNGTAGLRAHAWINGPWTTLSSDYGWTTFMHESGHIFGALDEYCPDQCQPASAQQGYLGMINANATQRPGGDGINGGQGEDMSSLMTANVPDTVQGYTRGAWGWLDTDGDGILDVRDTFPKSALTATVSGANVRLTGTITDVPVTRMYGDGASFNKITSLEYRAASTPTTGTPSTSTAPWMAVPVTTTVRGVAAVDLDLGAFPKGAQSIEVRAVSSVGNVEPMPQKLSFTIAGTAANSAPRVRLTPSAAVGSTRSTFTLDASAFDFDGDALQYRFDTNGDGRFETTFAASARTTAKYTTPGTYTAVVEAKDARGLTTQAKAEILVQDGNALPRVTLSPVVSPAFGTGTLNESLKVLSAVDPDGDALEYNWTAEIATTDQVFTTSTGFAAANTTFPTQLTTPLTLRTTPLDLTGGEALPKMNVSKVVAITPTLLATAGGRAGVLFTDISNVAQPRLVAHLDVQTEANQLLLDGKRLYVVGPSLLTIVDLTNLTMPVEIPQTTPFKAVRTMADSDVFVIDEGGGQGQAGHDYAANYGERISSVEVSITVDHPAPAELALSLVGPNGNEIVLRDHVAGPSGVQTYSYTILNAQGLTAFANQLASGAWRVVANDTVPGNVGQLQSSTLTFRTSSKATPIVKDGLAMGVLSGRYVVLTGAGVQVLDTNAPKAVKEIASLTGTGTYGAGLVGTTLVGIGPVDTVIKGQSVAAKPSTTPAVRGIFAVDFTNPKKPVVKKTDITHPEGGTLFTQGSRFYLSLLPAGGKGGGGVAPPTSINSVSAFAAGRAYALGTMPQQVSRAFGDDRTMTGIAQLGGSIITLDITNPAAVKITQSLFRPQVSNISPIGNGRVIFADGPPTVRLATLTDVTSIISRVFRITLEARDGHGVASVSRAQHLVPYDHAPSLDGVTVTPNATTTADTTFTLTTSDADRGTTWDPSTWTRADLDGDGIFEGQWMIVIGSQPATYTTRFATPGTRTVRFQVRDGFYGLSTRDVTVQVR